MDVTGSTSELSESKRLLLGRWLSGAAGTPGIPRHPGTGPVEATPAQRRMWVHAKLYPDSAAYHVGLALRLTGPLDQAALGRALTDLVARHDSLRTTFTEIDGRPWQVVAPTLAVAPAVETASAQRPWLARMDTAPFDLARGPLIRFGLLAVTEREHLLSIVVHHAVADGLSLSLLLRELGTRYGDYVAGRPGVLATPAIRYVDYAEWLRARRDGASGEHLEYWRRTFGGQPPRLDLPTDRTRPPAPSFRAVSSRFEVDAETWTALRAMGRRHQATEYMVVLAAFAVLLYRYTGQTGITIGSVVHGRDRPELENLVGCFADTLALRVELDGAPVFGELLDRVRQACRDAYAHQDVPFDVVAADLRWDRGAASGPVPHVLAIMQNVPEAGEMGGLRVEPVDPDVDSARFDLVLNSWESKGQLHGAITGNADLFEPATVARTAARLGRLLTALGGAEHVPVAALPLLPDAEHELLRRWGQPIDGDDPLVDRDLAALVSAAARRDPTAVAVECGQTRLTYGELEKRAERLAGHLRSLGVGPEVLVGVLMGRSADLVVALLAVLKAGGAFVPLEPSWPAPRIGELAARAGLRLVLADAAAAVLVAATGLAVVDPLGRLDVDPPSGDRARVAMENVAYVIHTSGSTGTPKGVMIRQQAICNRMRWQIGKLGLRPDDAVLHKAPLGFDISINEIFLPLVAGARLVVAEPGHDGDVDHLLATIEGHAVTFLYIVASMLAVLLERDDVTTRTRSLRHVWCGGEALTSELYATFRRAVDARMYHGYGPAEATIGVSCRVFEPGEPAGRISIGRPNPNARLYVLDGALRPAPVGVPGELCVGGLPLARGYLGDPGRTAERFVPDPYASGGRMYRTGDLARFRADGEIEFLGRTDDQVKIRGFRVEPAEVAAVLTRHPGVRQAAVVAREAAAGGYELVGYCTTSSTVDTGELRAWLGGVLPEYLVPRVVIVLPELPLTPAGKIDRGALAQVADPLATDAVDGYVAPVRGLEQAIAGIWAEVLGASQVGARDHFFDLGGHSLLLVRVQTLIRQRLDLDVPLLDLFTHATVARLAAHLARPAEDAGPARPPESPVDLARERERRGREALALRRARRGGTTPTTTNVGTPR